MMRLAKLVLPLLLLVSPCLAAEVRSLRLLTEEYPPFNMTVANGQIGGLATDIVRELFRRDGLGYSIEVQPWIRGFNTTVLENNTCLFSTTRTDNREHQFKWVGPLLENPWVLYAGPLSPPVGLDLESVRRYKLGGYNGDAVAQYLIARGFNVELTPADVLNARKLAKGRIDFWATGKYLGHGIVRQEKLSELHQVLVFNVAFMYLACNPGVSDHVVYRLNTVLQGMQQDGFMARAARHYLTE